MRLVARLLFVAVVAAVPVGLAVISCGTDADGVDACRAIESTRCNLAQACEPSSFSVQSCESFYYDECLVGVENPDAGNPVNPQWVTNCVNDLGTVSKCASLDSCNVMLDGYPCGDAGADAGLPTPCEVITVCPEVLTNCGFVVTPDAGTDAGEDAGEDAADAAEDADSG